MYIPSKLLKTKFQKLKIQKFKNRFKIFAIPEDDDDITDSVKKTFYNVLFPLASRFEKRFNKIDNANIEVKSNLTKGIILLNNISKII